MANIHDDISAALALANLCSVNSNPQMSFNYKHISLPQHGDLLRLQQLQQTQLQTIQSQVRSLSSLSSNIDNPRIKTSAPKKKRFAQKLFDVLESGHHSDIVTWLPGGKAFIVVDKKRFATEILPHYFKESQYTSFTRKLSRWKFKRIPRGQYIGAYYHKNFRRDNKDLCKLMSCSNSGKDCPKKDLNESDDDENNSDFPIIEMPTQKVVNLDTVVSTRTLPNGKEKNQNRPDPKHDRVENSMTSTNHNIQLIKERLLLIRLEKERVQEKKRMILMMQTEAARLREIHRLKNAVNLSIQQAEARIIAASRAIRKSRSNTDIVRDQLVMNHSPLSFQQLHTQLQSFRRTLPNSTSDAKEKNTSRAFAA